MALQENPNDTTSPLINIHFLRIKAVNAKPQLDPLVLIQGGPGGSSQIMAYALHRYFSAVRQNRDLLFIDLRGTGESNPLNCTELDTLDSSLNDIEMVQAYQIIMKKCASTLEKNAPFYTTATAVTDLEHIRLRLGYRQFNLWGASYGSRVALTYAAEYPAFTRSLILDGLAPSAISLPRFIARDAFAALTQLNRYCQENHLCHSHYGDLIENTQIITQNLHATKPVRVILPDPLNQQPKEWLFTPRRFAQLLISILYSRELTSLAPRALKEAAKGNYQLLATLNALAEANNKQRAVAEGLYYSVICNEDLAQNTPAPEPIFMGINLLEDKLAVCANWPQKILPEIKNPTTKTNNTPTLLLSGALDPVTPKVWADWVARTQLNHQSIEVPGGNHVVSTLGCLPNLIAQFINTPNTSLITDCTQNIAPLPFYLGADQAQNKEANTNEENKSPHNKAKHD
jgi:pimeloyl-ACP methyl ester carboxylesterase